MRGVKQPRVGLLNNGTEDTKGTPVHQEAYKLLAEDKSINFIGNVERVSCLTAWRMWS